MFFKGLPLGFGICVLGFEYFVIEIYPKLKLVYQYRRHLLSLNPKQTVQNRTLLLTFPVRNSILPSYVSLILIAKCQADF